jgi:hypothetical protein
MHATGAAVVWNPISLPLSLSSLLLVESELRGFFKFVVSYRATLYRAHKPSQLSLNSRHQPHVGWSQISDQLGA